VAAARREDGALTAPAGAEAPVRNGAAVADETRPGRPAVTAVFVCVSCRSPVAGAAAGEPAFEEPGRGLAAALAERLAGDAALAVVPVECLAVCKRPCTVAFAAEGKWTYILGDLEAGEHLGDLAAAARAYAASETGIVRWADRPPCFRKGVVARVPPAAFRPERAPT
jgi:predicted metal-binding protein